ncbi:hypothetical protein PIROE2DRAFT_13404 [Piromyces sp. E2]|nr:hypothetical protein PIROE2DRAFT_13404 [Piromyces sp. E2]|eukprot:OUM60766.1 hypothetical protein PIROE2DRAFT_13404 [Piromyces sp. E2]
MILINNFFAYINLLLLYIFFIDKLYSFNLSADNDDHCIERIANITNSDYNEIYINFNKDYYKISNNGRNQFFVKSDITFYSDKGTIFDFQKSKKSTLYFNIVEKKYVKIIFKNITFFNFGDHEGGTMISVDILNDTKGSYKYSMEFENCIFKNNNDVIYYNKISCINPVQSIPQAIFNNCTFIDSEQIFYNYHINKDYNVIKSCKCYTLYMSNCYFNNIISLGRLNTGDVIIDNCYFSNIIGDKKYNAAIISSSNKENKIIIKNTIFEKNDVQKDIPFFDITRTSLE